MEGSDEALDVRSSDSSVGGVTLCLSVDTVKAKLVLFDYAVEPLITGSSEVFSGARSASVPHSREDLEDQLLQEGWVAVSDSFEDF